MKLYEIDMEIICNYMKMIWKLYENRYLTEINNKEKIYKSNI